MPYLPLHFGWRQGLLVLFGGLLRLQSAKGDSEEQQTD
jgi:hypothetical protein